MGTQASPERLVELRRDFHRHPEPAWCEFYTTSRVIQEIEEIGVDALYTGADALATEHRMSVPSGEELSQWRERARSEGIPERYLKQIGDGLTGAVAVLEKGSGPTVGLWVDIDGLRQHESTNSSHTPVAKGFASKYDGMMHACGHDAHAAIGLGVLDAVKASSFDGRFKVFFEPAEEAISGGKPMANSRHLDGVDYLLAMHVGLDHPTGEVVANIEGFLSVTEFEAQFNGESAHAGAKPNKGNNAIQAVATAIQNIYAVPRHAEGASRINTGVIGGGTASNVVPETAFLEGEVRGETTDIRDYLYDQVEGVLCDSASMHNCTVDVEIEGEAPSADSDPELSRLFAETAGQCSSVETVIDKDWVGASTDATYFMHKVQQNGGQASYVCIGSTHPTGHHTSTFDVDEACLPIAVEVLTKTVEQMDELDEDTSGE